MSVIINETESLENSDRTSLKKLPKENTQQYLWRVDSLIKEDIHMSWNSICDIVNRELFGDNESLYKTESAYRKEVAAARRFFEAGVFVSDTDATVKQIREERDRLYKVKRSLADQRREYNKLLVQDARADNLTERLIEVANQMNKDTPLLDTPIISYPSDKEALLVLTDWHYGLVTDNIWNTYNVEICKARVKEVVEKTVQYLRIFNINRLHVCLLGDAIHGAIHVSCRVAAEENTVEQLMHVSELLAETIEELSKYVNHVDYYTCCGNHARTITKKEDAVNGDNLERVLPWWIEQRLQNNHKVHVHYSDFKEFTVIGILGYNVCAVHGDLDNVREIAPIVHTLFSQKYGKQIHYVISGDKHHLEEFDRMGIPAMIVPSLCGCDEYANNKRLYSSAGQTLMIFNKEEGRECTRNIMFK